MAGGGIQALGINCDRSGLSLSQSLVLLDLNSMKQVFSKQAKAAVLMTGVYTASQNHDNEHHHQHFQHGKAIEGPHLISEPPGHPES